LSFAFEIKMELEFIQVNQEARSRISDHFCPPGPGCNPGFFRGLSIFQK
jgi:hypothetical protein